MEFAKLYELSQECNWRTSEHLVSFADVHTKGPVLCFGQNRSNGNCEQISGRTVVFVTMIKRTKRPEIEVVKVEAAAAEAMEPVPVKVIAPLSRIVLEFVNPAAQQVLVASSFSEWKPALTPFMAAGDGRWTCNLKSGPGRQEYLLGLCT